MIHLACGCDDNYARHTAAMLVSAFENLPRDLPATVHLLHDANLSLKNIAKIRESLPPNATLVAVDVPEHMMAGLPSHMFHLSCWHRVFLPDLLPNLDRLLYLDSDMIVVSNLSPLWQTNLAGYAFAAVVNPLYPFQLRTHHPLHRLGLQNLDDYLNSGCLLMDLAQMRSLGFATRIKEYAAANPDNSWPEQDAISAIFQSKWLKLHPRWNWQSTFLDLNSDSVPVAASIYREASANPGIIHFVGPNKPWKYICRHPYQSAYLRAANKTAWGRLPLEEKSLRNLIIRMFFPPALRYRIQAWKAHMKRSFDS